MDDDITTIGDVMSAGFMRTPERHPIVRDGPREDIPWHVRAAVYYRDRYRCEMCPDRERRPEGALHLDHIVPWSAGGTDDTSNLRTLCERHNLERSNYVDFARPKSSATWWCHRCFDPERHDWLHDLNGYVECPVHRSLRNRNHCRVQRIYDRMMLGGEPIDWWHDRGQSDIFQYRAFCAHCGSPGLTSIVL